METYEAVVIGAGQAGPGMAGSLAVQGEHVALIEMDRVGGTCLNHGCRPTKALRASGVVANLARRAGEYGVGVGDVRVDFAAAMERVHTMIDGMRQSVLDWVDSVEQIDLIRGGAQLRTGTDGDHRVLVGDRELQTRKVYLDLGARPVIPPIDGLADVDYLTEVELLALRELPAHLVVVGGGYIGLEFAQMFRRFGSEVTVIAGGGVAPREDPDVSAILTSLLTDEGVRIVPSRTQKVAGEDGAVFVWMEDGTRVTGSHILVATGRRPNTDTLGPDHGLAVDDRGYLVIDNRFATSVPGVWALGDVNGHGAFTHTAYQDAQILTNEHRSLKGRITSYAMFTDPPLGRVGMTTAEARASGRRVLKAEVPMSSVSRAILDSETIGVMRLLVDADSEEFLGATFLGLHGDDLAQIIGLAMQAGVTYPTVRDMLPIHPTMAEFIPSILRSITPLDD